MRGCKSSLKLVPVMEQIQAKIHNRSRPCHPKGFRIRILIKNLAEGLSCIPTASSIRQEHLLMYLDMWRCAGEPALAYKESTLCFLVAFITLLQDVWRGKAARNIDSSSGEDGFEIYLSAMLSALFRSNCMLPSLPNGRRRRWRRRE